MYIDKISNNKEELDVFAFFIPDSIMIQFLIHTEDDEILNMKELESMMIYLKFLKVQK